MAATPVLDARSVRAYSAKVGSGFAIRIRAVHEFAHGSANSHIAGSAHRTAAAAQGRAGDCGGRSGSRRRPPARRADPVVPLRDDGLLRDDCRRLCGLFLIRPKEFHDGSDHSPAGYHGGIRRKPAGRPRAHAVGAGWTARCGSTCRNRRAVSTGRPGRPDRDRKEHAGPPDPDLLRLHPLSRYMPDLAVRDFRGAAGDGQGCRSRQRLFHFGRSRARHHQRR